MELIRRTALLALFAALVAAGCGAKEPMSTDKPANDPYAGMSKEQKIQEIQKDPKITDMQKQSMIAEINAKG